MPPKPKPTCLWELTVWHTQNGYEENWKPTFNEDVICAKWRREKGEEKGDIHTHIAVRLKVNTTSFKKVQNAVGETNHKSHVAGVRNMDSWLHYIQKGENPEDCKRNKGKPCQHCQKQSISRYAEWCKMQTTHTHGTEDWSIQNQQGIRTDLEEARNLIETEEYKTWNDIIDDKRLDVIRAKHMKWLQDTFHYYKSKKQLEKLKTKEDMITIDQKPYKWQKDVLKMLDEGPKKRRIIWIWSDESGTGKTQFSNYIKCAGMSVLTPESSIKLSDLVHMYNDEQVIFFDLARWEGAGETNNFNGAHFYNLIDTLSDHQELATGKYGGKQVYVKSHIIVAASREPNPDFRLPGRYILIKAEKTYEEDDMKM